MQAALVTLMPMAANCADAPADAASSNQGLRMNSELQSQTTDILFTKILQQGIAVGVPFNTALSDGLGDITCTDDAKKTGGDESVDVCSLLMQLMVMNSSVQTDGNNGNAAGQDDKAVNGVLGIINEMAGMTDGMEELKGLENAAAVILQNDGKAAEVLRALAASKNAGAVADNTSGNADSVQPDGIFAGITGALKSELKQAAGAEGNAADVSADFSLKTDGTAISNNGNAQETAASGEAAHEVAAGVSGGGKDDNTGFNGGASREENKIDELGAAGIGTNQTLSQAEAEGEATALKASAALHALDRFTDDLRSIRSGNHEIKIVLEPESLGVLTISVIKTESGISAKIKSDDKEVAAIISNHIQKLVTSMQSKGITVDDVDVVYSHAEQNTSFTQHGFSQARDESRGGYASHPERNADLSTPDTDIWQSYYVSEAGGDTTVDYRV